MTKMCTKCCRTFEVEDEYIGYDVICPHCGAEVHVPKPGARKVVRAAAAPQAQPADANGALCFFLGFLFNLFGLLIAAIIGKQKGCVFALYGLLAEIFVGIVLCVLAGLV